MAMTTVHLFLIASSSAAAATFFAASRVSPFLSMSWAIAVVALNMNPSRVTLTIRRRPAVMVLSLAYRIRSGVE
jgi:hypothetical protein